MCSYWRYNAWLDRCRDRCCDRDGYLFLEKIMEILLVSLCHNRSNLVSLAIQSAVNQTYKNFTHLLIDNASTDKVPEVCNIYTKKYPNIIYQRFEENRHQMPAYNWALEWAKTNCPKAEVMVHLDSDDLLMTNALEEVAKTFKQYQHIGQTYSDFDIIDGKNRIKIKAHPKAKMVSNQLTPEGQLTLRRIFVAQNPIGHLRAMRIDCLRELGGFDETKRFATDFNMAGKMLEKYAIIKIPKTLYQWRQHDQQVERQHSPEQTKNWQDLQAYYKERWKSMKII